MIVELILFQPGGRGVLSRTYSVLDIVLFRRGTNKSSSDRSKLSYRRVHKCCEYVPVFLFEHTGTHFYCTVAIFYILRYVDVTWTPTARSLKSPVRHPPVQCTGTRWCWDQSPNKCTQVQLQAGKHDIQNSSSPRIESTQPKRWNSVSTHSKYNNTSFQTNTVHRSPTLEQPHYLIQSLVCVQHRLEKPPYPEAVSISVKYLWMSVGQNIKPQQQQIARTDN